MLKATEVPTTFLRRLVGCKSDVVVGLRLSDNGHGK